MSGISNSDVALLKHDLREMLQKWDYTILNQIWYSSSKQAYIQRNQHFDNTPFCKASSLYLPIVDSLLLALLFKVFHLNAISHITDDKADDALEKALLPEYAKKENILLLGNRKYGVSVLYAFDDKLRNSFAHGTFNILDDGTALFVGQAQAKQESPMNFYLRIERFEYIMEWQETVEQLPSSLDEFIRKTYSMYFPVRKTATPNLYRREDGAYVYFDVDFTFMKIKDGAENQDEQLKHHIGKRNIKEIMSGEARVYYILSGASNSRFEQTQDTYPLVQIIARNKLLSHLGVHTIS